MVLISLGLYKNFQDIAGFQFVTSIQISEELGLNYTQGIDGLSLMMLILNQILFLVCALFVFKSLIFRIRSFFTLFFILQGSINLTFIATDLLVFYIAFEISSLVIFILINMWGPGDRKGVAAKKFMLYTLIGSVIGYTAIIIIQILIGSTEFHVLTLVQFSFNLQCLLFIMLFFMFAVKTPIFPIHSWLPEAHVEASSPCSMILAGILLKIGGFGILRYLIPLFPIAYASLREYIGIFCFISILLSCFSSCAQADMKKALAYSSIAHMNFALLGIFTHTIISINGGILLMIGHGFVSAALFFCVGVLYERYESRNVYTYGSMSTTFPIFSVFLLFFVFANIATPGTFNFFAEFLILIGLTQYNFFLGFILGILLVGTSYMSIWIGVRVLFGPKNEELMKINDCDVNLTEFLGLCILTFFTLLLGFFPTLVTAKLRYFVLLLISY